jgi:hypothetical protein
MEVIAGFEWGLLRGKYYGFADEPSLEVGEQFVREERR